MDLLNFFLIFILLVLFPLGQVFRIQLSPSIAVNPLDIGVFATAITSVVATIVKRKFPPYIKPLGIFAGLGALGLLMNLRVLSSQEFFVSILYLFRFLAYAIIGITVSLLSPKHKTFLWKVLLIAGGVVVTAGYIQYFFYQSLWGVLYEGWDPHLYRMFSTWLDPNFTGVFFALYFLLLLHTWFLQKTPKTKILFGIAGILTFLAVILSFSRGAYVDLGASVLVYLFLKGYKKIAFGIPVLVVTLSIFIAFFLPYGEEKHLFRTASTQARLVSAENALAIFEKNPIVGVGFNAYRYAQHRYHLLNGFNWEDTHSGAGANNSYVFVLATTGMLGGVVYGWFWLIILKDSIASMKKQKPYSLFLFVSMITLLISGVFENTLFYPSLMVWMFVLVGFIG